MTTNARPNTSDSAHWYCPSTGKAVHAVPNKDGSGMRPTTIRDARDHGYVPSVTTILKCIDKPALTNWKIEQAVLAAITSPRGNGEDLDAFVKRVLDQDADAEAQKARDLGTDIHAAIESALNCEPYPQELAVYVEPVVAFMQTLGRCVATEMVVFGQGYAGTLDAKIAGGCLYIVDIKTTGAKGLPKKSYPEHRLQLSAYAATEGNTGDKRIKTMNIYVSTREPGKIMTCIHDDWQETFSLGFLPVLRYWQWINGV